MNPLVTLSKYPLFPLMQNLLNSCVSSVKVENMAVFCHPCVPIFLAILFSGAQYIFVEFNKVMIRFYLVNGKEALDMCQNPK